MYDADSLASLSSAVDGLVGFGACAEPDTWSAEQAIWVAETARRAKNAAGALESLAAARVAGCGAWRGEGDASAAEWLARHGHTSVGSARAALALGAALAEHGPSSDAARCGSLSMDQATAITDAALYNPAAEAALVAHAQGESLADLRQACARAKAVGVDLEEQYDRRRAGRHLRRYEDDDGGAHLHFCSVADQRALIDAVLDELTDEIFRIAHAEGRAEPREAYAADALVEMARRARHGAGPSRRSSRYRALIRVDMSALVRGEALEGERCEIAGIGPIPVARARELLGESLLEIICTNGADANVTHAGRGPNATQRIALLWQSTKCAVAGCERTARIEFDHTAPYSATHHTTLAELERKCSHHHRLKTTKGWETAVGEGRRPMVPPRDPRHPASLFDAKPAP